MVRPVAFLAALSLCATAALAVNVTGIVAPDQLNSTQPASSGSTCSVVLQPFTIYSPTFNSSLPTTSPVPPYVLASLSFAVYNQGSEAISAPWTLQLSSSHYQAVLQVGPRACLRLWDQCRSHSSLLLTWLLGAGHKCRPPKLHWGRHHCDGLHCN